MVKAAGESISGHSCSSSILTLLLPGLLSAFCRVITPKCLRSSPCGGSQSLVEGFVCCSLLVSRAPHAGQASGSPSRPGICFWSVLHVLVPWSSEISPGIDYNKLYHHEEKR